MGMALGDKLCLNTAVRTIDPQEHLVNGEFKADIIVNTIPWSVWASVEALPDGVASATSRLVSVPIHVDYHAETMGGSAHWIYEPDERISFHRILVRSHFTPGSRGYWTETNGTVSSPAAGFRHRNEFAYPVNTIDKPEAVASIRQWAETTGVLPLGRWGRWEHMNSDVAVAQSIQAAEGALH
jgi:hypothetical protein